MRCCCTRAAVVVLSCVTWVKGANGRDIIQDRKRESENRRKGDTENNEIHTRTHTQRETAAVTDCCTGAPPPRDTALGRAHDSNEERVRKGSTCRLRMSRPLAVVLAGDEYRPALSPFNGAGEHVSSISQPLDPRQQRSFPGTQSAFCGPSCTANERVTRFHVHPAR